MTLRELASLTKTAERQIRFLIAEGFIPPPRGGRANADYGDDHAAAIHRYTRLRELGFPPAAIRLLLDGKEGAPFPVAPGITLVIDPELFGTDADPDPLVESVKALLTKVLKENHHDYDRSSTDD